jgi:uncharacterized protein YecE (DUF72 family)
MVGVPEAHPSGAAPRSGGMGAIIGTAGWSIPTDVAAAFPAGGSSLERYAARFAGAEINSSFHRRHRESTWQRWAESVPAEFRFSVKLPKTITHVRKLAGCEEEVAHFIEEVRPLGAKLAVLLVQLPPKLAFDAALAEPFFAALGRRTTALLACEPRHPTWFDDEADALLKALEVARVAADPAVVEAAGVPGGWSGIAYWRLHGSPRMYRSSYDEQRLDAYAAQMRAPLREGRQVWCIFDNTAGSAAAGNALALMEKLS